MPLTVAQLVARLTADTSGFYRGMAIANSSMIRSGGIISRVSAGAGLAVLGMGVLSLRAAGNFQESMNILEAVSHATGNQMGALRKEAIALGADFKLPNVSAKDAANAMTELAKGGLSVNQIMKATRGTLQLGLAANVDFADSAVIVARALTAFHLQGDQAAKIADLFAAAANSTTAEITDLALGVQMASAQFHAGDQSIQSLTTALGMMADAGIVGSDAGTSLKTMMNRLMAPTKKSKDLMEKFGISIYDSAGNMRPMPGLIQQFTHALGGQTKEQRNANLYTIFGSDAIRAARVVLLGGTDTWNQYSKEINRAGEAQRITEARTRGFNGALQAAGSAVETLAIQLGTAMLPAATDATRAFTNFVNSIDPNKIIATFTAVAHIVEGLFNLVTGSGVASRAIQVLIGSMIAYTIAMRTAAAAQAIYNTSLVTGAAGAVRFTFTTLSMVRSLADLGAAFRILSAAVYSSLGPLGLAALAIGALTTIILLHKGHTDSLTAAYQRATNSLYEFINATKQAKADHLTFKEAQVGVQQAAIGVARAQENLTRVLKDGHSSTLDIKEAQTQLTQAFINQDRAQLTLTDAREKDNKSQEKAKVLHAQVLDAVSSLHREYQPLIARYQRLAEQFRETNPLMAKYNDNLAKEKVKEYADRLDDMAIKAAKVAAANRESHPQVAKSAAAMRDQALATAGLARKLNQIPTAVSNSKAAAHAEAVGLGLSITDGVIVGLGGILSRATATISTAVTGAIQAAKAQALRAKSPSKVAAEELGKPIADGIIMGFLLGSADLPEKMNARLRQVLESMKKTVDNYKTKISDAFGRMANDALRAFDAITQAHMTPTEQFIDAQEKAFEKADLEQRVKDAEKALQDARESGDPEAILQAERDLERARWEITKLGLEAQAAEERKQYEAQRELQRRHLEDSLNELEKQLEKHPEAWRKINKQITALLNANGITYESAGAVLGNAFAKGLWESRHEVFKVVRALARIIERALKLNSPAKEGPLSDLNKWWTPFASTLLQGLQEDQILNGIYAALGTPRGSIMGSPVQGTYRGLTGPGSAGVVVNINGLTLLSGDRVAARQLADTLGPMIEQRITTAR